MRLAITLLAGGCAGNACTCLLAYGGARMTEAEVAALPAAADECFGATPEEVEANGTCLPLTVGTDASNGIDLVASVLDGELVFTYDSVGYEDCCATGGRPRFDAASEFVGCEPAVLATATECLTPP